MGHSLLDIFYSNSRIAVNFQALDELQFLLDEKIIKIKFGKKFTQEEFYKVIDRINSKEIKIFDYQGGEIRHLALKYLAEELLKNLHKTPKIEQLYNNRYPDVMSEDREIIVECGDTDPQKIIEYFNGEIKNILIIPYPTSESKIFTSYKFECDFAGLAEYCAFKANKDKNSILNIINRR
jgi:hypothetical protein